MTGVRAGKKGLLGAKAYRWQEGAGDLRQSWEQEAHRAQVTDVLKKLACVGGSVHGGQRGTPADGHAGS